MALLCIEISQRHVLKWENDVIPINISRYRHLTGNFSGRILVLMYHFKTLKETMNTEAKTDAELNFIRNLLSDMFFM